MKITAITEGGYAEDFSNIRFTLAEETGATIALDMTPDFLDNLLNHLAELLRAVRQSQIQSNLTHFSIPSALVVDAEAQAPIGGGRVVLGLKGTNGMIQNFSLSIEQSEKLRPQMRKAEETARREGGQTRQ